MVDYTLAHLSDPHVSPLPPVLPWQLVNKRLLGFLSWFRRRRAIHRMDVLELLCRDLLAQRPDHIAVTGDLINISLPGEFRTAARWLETLGDGNQVTVVPGNHDAYVPVAWETGCGLWRPYMRGDEAAPESPAHLWDFPQVRRRGDIALIGLSTALPTPPGFATGTLGEEQLARFEACLSALGKAGLFRVVLLHHPPLDDESVRKRLTDAAAFRAVVARAGAELILHGHDHTYAITEIPGPNGPVPVAGVPSASARRHRRPAAAYYLFRIRRNNTGWMLSMRVRAYVPEQQDFRDEETREFTTAA